MRQLSHSARKGRPPQRYREHVAGVIKRPCENISEMESFIGESERNQLRKELYDCCLAAPVEEPLTYCDSPVGTGKTTAVMAHMLKAAIRRKLRHIFVVLPYTSIISQTVDVLRNALVLDGEDPYEIVAEHHHQADFESPALRRLAATWTAPIIVTTAVQFFETIASNMPSKLRKLHQLPGSGVIIDECHVALPAELMPAAWSWVSQLVGNWGCRFCLCSATSFRFWEEPFFNKMSNLKVQSLLESSLALKLERFEKKRIHFNARVRSVPHFQNISELIGFIEKHDGSRLVVLNTVRSAAFLAKKLRNRGHDVLHLSTALTPSDRDAVIREVKRRINPAAGYARNWTLIATSIVECGMDFSFNHGFCEMRSLQSFLQIGGRISRNDEYDGSTLNCFTITEDQFGHNPYFDISISVFKKQIESGALSALGVTDAVSQSFSMECKSRGGLSDEICKHERRRAFKDVAKLFRVIPEDKITVIANLQLAEKHYRGEFVSKGELQRGSVSMRRSVLRRLRLDASGLPVLLAEQYDDFLGYMKSLV